MSTPPTRAVIFDLDGTLLDSLEDLADSVNAVLAARDMKTQPVDAYRYYVGDGVTNLVRRAIAAARGGTPPDPRTLEECIRATRAEYSTRWAAKTRPYPGIPELLAGLRARGIHLGVLTNKPHDFAPSVVERFLGRDTFDAVLGARADIPNKPDPTGAREILRLLDVDPSEVLYVGDTGTDMDTAHAAGIESVGALWGFRPRSELVAHRAVHLIEKPGDLLNHLRPADAAGGSI